MVYAAWLAPYDLSQVYAANPEIYAAEGVAGHTGADWAISCGTPIPAVAAGVAHLGFDPQGYGRYVTIDQEDGGQWLSAHMSEFAIQDGQYVDEGTILGLSGGRKGDPTAGLSTGCHWHLGRRQPGWESHADDSMAGFVDPLPEIGGGAEPGTPDTKNLTYEPLTPPTKSYRPQGGGGAVLLVAGAAVAALWLLEEA